MLRVNTLRTSQFCSFVEKLLKTVLLFKLQLFHFSSLCLTLSKSTTAAHQQRIDSDRNYYLIRRSAYFNLLSGGSLLYVNARAIRPSACAISSHKIKFKKGNLCDLDVTPTFNRESQLLESHYSTVTTTRELHDVTTPQQH